MSVQPFGALLFAGYTVIWVFSSSLWKQRWESVSARYRRNGAEEVRLLFDMYIAQEVSTKLIMLCKTPTHRYADTFPLCEPSDFCS